MTPRTALREAMIASPTVTATNDRAKLVWKNLCRSQARVSSSLATTMIAALIAAAFVAGPACWQVRAGSQGPR